MSLVLTLFLTTTAPDVGCAAMQRCIDSLHAELCARYDGALPANLSNEEWAIGQIEKRMADARCVVSERRGAGCDEATPVPGDYPPETCAGLVEAER